MNGQFVFISFHSTSSSWDFVFHADLIIELNSYIRSVIAVGTAASPTEMVSFPQQFAQRRLSQWEENWMKEIKTFSWKMQDAQEEEKKKEEENEWEKDQMDWDDECLFIIIKGVRLSRLSSTIASMIVLIFFLVDHKRNENRISIREIFTVIANDFWQWSALFNFQWSLVFNSGESLLPDSSLSSHSICLIRLVRFLFSIKFHPEFIHLHNEQTDHQFITKKRRRRRRNESIIESKWRRTVKIQITNDDRLSVKNDSFVGNIEKYDVSILRYVHEDIEWDLLVSPKHFLGKFRLYKSMRREIRTA